MGDIVLAQYPFIVHADLSSRYLKSNWSFKSFQIFRVSLICHSIGPIRFWYPLIYFSRVIKTAKGFIDRMCLFNL